MRTRLFYFALFAIVAINANAQSDNSYYLNTALEKLKAGDCESAQKFYNVYKDLSGSSISSVEVLIADCSRKASVKYAINDKIKVGDLLYRVAYIEDDGKHGFAIYDYGSGPINEQMITERKLPTRAEMNLLYPHRKELNLLLDISYWTNDIALPKENYSCWMSSNPKSNIDFTNESHTRSREILYIYRF